MHDLRIRIENGVRAGTATAQLRPVLRNRAAGLGSRHHGRADLRRRGSLGGARREGIQGEGHHARRAARADRARALSRADRHRPSRFGQSQQRESARRDPDGHRSHRALHGRRRVHGRQVGVRVVRAHDVRHAGVQAHRRAVQASSTRTSTRRSARTATTERRIPTSSRISSTRRSSSRRTCAPSSTRVRRGTVNRAVREHLLDEAKGDQGVLRRRRRRPHHARHRSSELGRVLHAVLGAPRAAVALAFRYSERRRASHRDDQQRARDGTRRSARIDRGRQVGGSRRRSRQSRSRTFVARVSRVSSSRRDACTIRRLS